MHNIKSFLIILFVLFAIPAFSLAGGPDLEDFDSFDTDVPNDTIVYFFDLRDRETFIQLTYTTFDAEDGDFDITKSVKVHVEIFDVSRDCVENNFFDDYTPNDTHVYNMRDIKTNDGNPSGVVLPDDAFGFVFVFGTDPDGTLDNDSDVFIGNLRILDNNGYEYRTNAVGEPTEADPIENEADERGYFNFNTLGGVTLSDVVGVVFDDEGDEPKVDVSPLDNFAVLNVDLFDLNENTFSCRNVIYACISEDSPLLEALLEKAGQTSGDDDDQQTTGSASVAGAEYGINNAIPHSKGGELLCPGNNISEGFVSLEVLNLDLGDDDDDADTVDDIVMWIGLNNGNGRGSMDTVWYSSDLDGFNPFPD